jgi:hypothetical protein
MSELPDPSYYDPQHPLAVENRQLREALRRVRRDLLKRRARAAPLVTIEHALRDTYPSHAEGLTQEAYESLLRKATEVAQLREALRELVLAVGDSYGPVTTALAQARRALGDTDHE